ncbi:M48 family metallopeptidase [Spirosoma litoris]
MFGQTLIRFSIQFAARKTLGIQVHPNGQVLVIAPLASDYQTVLEKVKTKAAWIRKQQAFFLSFEPRQKPRLYINGESHSYLGKQYRLKLVLGADKKVTAVRGYLTVQLPNVSLEAVRRLLENWYKERALLIFNEILAEVLPSFERYSLIPPHLEIKRMEKRWGSCTTKGKIILNTDLVKAAKPCIRYVIVHELCHLLNYSHNSAFYELLNRMMPDWEKWKQKLEHSLA